MRSNITAGISAALMLFAALAICSCSGCRAEIGHAVNVLQGQDRIPPRLLSMAAVSPTQIQIKFDEPVTLSRAPFPCMQESHGNIITITLDSPLAPGSSLSLSAAAQDARGNMTSFSGTIYGFNPRTPSLLITELTTAGTSKSPDRTELLALSDGNMAGVTLYDGVIADFSHHFIFPDTEIRRGEYIVLQWTGEPPDSTQSVHHFSAMRQSDPSQYNGIQMLCEDPSRASRILDCVIYTNHNGQAHSRFGSKQNLARAKTAIGLGAWKAAAIDNGEITGLCGVDSSKATATRSMSRRFPYEDTDSNADWQITATGGSTFGSDNLSPPYSPEVIQ